MRRENLDVQGEKPVRSDPEELCLDRARDVAWKENYDRLSNVEFNWDSDSLSEVYPVEGLAPTSHLSWWSRPSNLWDVQGCWYIPDRS